MNRSSELPQFDLAWLRPSRIVLVGASNRAGSVGKVICDNLLAERGSYVVQTVNPKPLGVAGAEHFTALSDLPSGPGLAVLAIPAKAVAEAIGQLGTKGIRLAIVISAGLGGTTEEGLAMLDAARAAGIRLVGPNCLGIILPHHRLNASFALDMPPPGDLALLSQSGAIATAMLQWAKPRDVGFSAVVSVGDMAQTGMGELIRLFSEDRNTSAILLYLEGLTDTRGFVEAARAASRIKPVIALKAGRSRAAGRAALSHTGALAGSWDVYRAAFRETGIVTVDTLEDMFDAAHLLDRYPDGAGGRLAIVTNGGGAGILAVDAMAATGARLAELSSETMAMLDRSLPPTWSRGNPVDVIGDADAARYRVAIDAVIADGGVDAVLVMNCPTGLIAPGEAAWVTAQSVKQARARGLTKPVFGCWLGDENYASAAAVLQAARIPVLANPADAVRAFGVLIQAERSRRVRPRHAKKAVSEETLRAARALLKTVAADGRKILSEIEAKHLLRLFAIPVVETRHVGSVEEIDAACTGIDPPFALKIVSPDITHKSDHGGVALGLADAASVRRAAKAMHAHIRGIFPTARIEGFALQPMIGRKTAHELFAGIATDETFGPVVLFGAGGTAIEVIADKAIGLPPVSSEQAREMIADTRISRVLGGYRHIPPADLEAIVEVLEALSRLSLALPEIAELDVNPLLADADGVISLDARVILA
ncbi:acetate--CoA ligase family protein [Erythrobacter sp.]|uniref:acetate--CoA ligase family protein n=1 Tax=Erythrobacter sp. TaxID=1042 RepID=UPI001B099FE0|nr:acetate--CoA ligase family protein [Erythrobacter sp.]MBO6526459.1 acetate--CoA ligase family protein [Erythrobacter sp.]MBO6529328.1 acetate--CoA ligase family protein [Erythrobacter sp.]